jgi:hypothetical protein
MFKSGVTLEVAPMSRPLFTNSERTYLLSRTARGREILRAEQTQINAEKRALLEASALGRLVLADLEADAAATGPFTGGDGGPGVFAGTSGPGVEFSSAYSGDPVFKHG